MSKVFEKIKSYVNAAFNILYKLPKLLTWGMLSINREKSLWSGVNVISLENNVGFYFRLMYFCEDISHTRGVRMISSDVEDAY